ncbi:hypothetical protein [Paraburkholderia sp. J8-2]|uniref:esterase/lipase family protein n=2 Tax=Paraburkholderia TaxID=1822464 RepID=UPI002AB6B08D|nr:hypothetical protein [Paraburkholderia sp. J8-2]
MKKVHFTFEAEMANQNSPFHPIIYVRGYAMTQGDIDQTAADPFCGYNVGSTIYRAVSDSNSAPRRFVFESPVVRLTADFQYGTVYSDGYDIVDPDWMPNRVRGLPPRCIVIFRYYDDASQLLGTGVVPSIETSAKQLAELIRKVREKLLESGGVANINDFRCYLVAHSMGGLVCRAFLQNDPDDINDDPRRHVAKFFTYATPHNGIDLLGLNVPRWLSKDDINNFNRERMAEYLNVKSAYAATGRVDWLPSGSINPDNVFCMVGTNRTDYEVAMGASRTFAGHGSDGLVRIENATLRSLNAKGEPGRPCAKAFTYRSHSGNFGIVNGEESYQNLTRFLFGDFRVDIWADITNLQLPSDVVATNKPVKALYQFELLASPRGKPWYLTRRVAEEDSVACLTHEEWLNSGGNTSVYLSTVFLANLAKLNPNDPTLAYSVTVGIKVPDYEVDGRMWLAQHFEGGYLFRKTLILHIVPPTAVTSGWTVQYEWAAEPTMSGGTVPIPPLVPNSTSQVTIPFSNPAKPGVSGNIRFVLSLWNIDRQQEK